MTLFNKRVEKGLNQLRKRCKKIPLLELAYQAGFFDGEGSIMAGNISLTKRHCPNVMIKYGNTDIRPVQFLSKYFGVKIQKQDLSNSNHAKTFYHAMLGELKSRIFLEKLLPYLIIKHRRAKLALRFYEEKFRIGNPKEFHNSKLLFQIRDKIAELNDRNHLLDK